MVRRPGRIDPPRPSAALPARGAAIIAPVRRIGWMGFVVSAIAGATVLQSGALAVDVGARAPEIGLRDMRGNRIRIGRYRGKVLIVNVWASWCEPCREELPAFQRLYARYYRQGLRVVGVNVDRDEGAMRRFVERTGVRFSNVHDADRAVARRWGGNTMPTTWVVDARGVVRHVNDGYHAGDERRVERVVRELLAELEPRPGGEDAAAPDETSPADEPASEDDAEPAAAAEEDEFEGDGAEGGPADAPPEVEPGETGRTGGLCSAAAGGTPPPPAAYALVLALFALGARRRS